MSISTVSFDKFLVMAKFFYISIGVEPFERAYGWSHSYLLDLFFVVNIVNLNFVLFSELAYVFLAMYNGNNFLEATMNLSYIGFVFVGDIKIWSIRFQKYRLTKLMQDLREIFPHAREEQSSKLEGKKFKAFVRKYGGDKQRDYGVYDFFWRYYTSGIGFAVVHLILIWTYNLFPITNYLLYELPRTLPYYCWVPWDWRDHWSYHFMYASQNLAGHTCMMGQLANDLLLCVVVTQIIMHYKYLAKRISNFVAALVEENQKNTESYDRDFEFLKSIVEYHQRVLSLSVVMNNVFGVSLLMNFMTSAFIMCFLGFQMTIGVNSTVLVMLMLFIFCSLVQVYMLTNYGQELILASESIGHAVYNHNWYDADVRYKKMLVLIIERAQKPAILKATTFLNVSLGTMTDLIQLSYKFFALLRTMYAK